MDGGPLAGVLARLVTPAFPLVTGVQGGTAGGELGPVWCGSRFRRGHPVLPGQRAADVHGSLSSGRQYRSRLMAAHRSRTASAHSLRSDLMWLATVRPIQSGRRASGSCGSVKGNR